MLETVSRYGAEIEWDLHAYWQVDIHSYFRGERAWAELNRFLDRVPSSSRFVIAQQNDPELALVIARRNRERQASGRGGRYRPPAVEWDTQAELLASLVDRLGEAVALLADLPTPKKRRTKPPRRVARPETAIERAERQLSEEHVVSIMADVEASYVTEEEYAKIAAEVERHREAEAAAREAVRSQPDGPPTA